MAASASTPPSDPGLASAAEPASDSAGESASPTARASADSTGGSTYPDARQRRQALADELLEALVAWPPRERMGTFHRWHQGALSLVHLNVVAALQAEGPLSMRALAEALDVSSASATGIVDRMERRGLVERRHSTDDRRLVLVHLTAGGAGIFDEFETHRRERLGRLVGELTEDELAGFLVGLRALRAAGQRLREKPAAPDALGCPEATGPGPASAGGRVGFASAATSPRQGVEP